MSGILSRIYLPLSKDYLSINSDCNIEKLLIDVAECKITDAYGNKLFDEKKIKGTPQRAFFMGQIKKLIADESNQFISKFEEAYSTETLGRYISKRQIKKLVRAFNEDEGRITGYTFVIFHIIYTIVRDIPDYDFNNLKNCSNAVFCVVNDYIADYPDDPIAYFLLQCYKTVNDEISNTKSQPAALEDFPPIPKRHNCDYDE